MALKDAVCLVTGASRGIGKGIAIGLGELGATVYITGRTLKPISSSSIGGSLEETVAEVNATGGKAIAVVVDHKNDDQVDELFQRIKREQNGRLDLLVNNAFSGANFLVNHPNQTYFENTDRKPGEVWDVINNVGLRNHYICSTLATNVMLDYQRKAAEMNQHPRPGLIVNISSVGGKRFLFHPAYGIGKMAMDRMACDMAVDLRSRSANICMISLWPGIVRTEELLDASKRSGSTEGIGEMVMDRNMYSCKLHWNVSNGGFIDHGAESTELTGRAIAALMSESVNKLKSRSGQIVLVSDVAREYSIKESDGHAPPDYRSLRTIFRILHVPLAGLIPSFIRIPRRLIMWLISRTN